MTEGVRTTDTWKMLMLYLSICDMEIGLTTTSPYCLGSRTTSGQYISHLTCASKHITS